MAKLITKKRKRRNKMYVLTVDVGNTNSVFGAYDENEKLAFEIRVETRPSRMADEYSMILLDIFNMHGVKKEEFEGVIISSVVPPVTEQLKTAVKRYMDIDAMVVGPGVKTGLNIKIDDPATLGADLCCAGVAAKELYPLPCIIVDLGTVSKILAVNEKGDFLGGALAVGLKMAFSSLSSGTAALPLISAGAVDKAIGTNTADCMRSGVIIGMAGTIDGFIDRFESEMGKAKSVVATGGYSGTVAPYCKHEMTLDSQLLLKGLLIIYRKNKQKS